MSSAGWNSLKSDEGLEKRTRDHSDPCKSSQFFKDAGINLKTIPLNSDAEGVEYQKSIKQAKQKYISFANGKLTI